MPLSLHPPLTGIGIAIITGDEKVRPHYHIFDFDFAVGGPVFMCI